MLTDTVAQIVLLKMIMLAFLAHCYKSTPLAEQGGVDFCWHFPL